MKTLALSWIIFASAAAHAACLSPNGVQGELRWNSPAVTYCDGNVWNSTLVTTTGTSCATTGEIKYVSGALTYCNGSVLVQMNGPTDGTCSAAQTGSLIYSTTQQSSEYCNGTNWLQTRSSTSAAAKVQQVSNGGTGTSGTNATTTAAFSSAVTAGNLMVCAFVIANNSAATGVSDNKGNTYQRTATKIYSSSFGALEIWYAALGTGGTSLAVTAQYASGNNGVSAAYSCTEFSGTATSNVFDQGNSASGTTDTASPGVTLTTTSAKELLYTVTIESNSCAAASGWTDISGSFNDLIQMKPVGNVGSYAMGTGSGCGSNWIMQAATFRSK